MRQTLRATCAALALTLTAAPAFAQGMDNFVGGPNYVTEGGGYTSNVAAAATGPLTFRIGSGRLARTIITTAGTTGNVTFYDNATACTGTVLDVVPGATNATLVGQLGYVGEPEVRFINGLTACGATGSPAITLSWW
jgi:hypothetical protein